MVDVMYQCSNASIGTVPSLQCLCIRKMGESFEWQSQFLHLKVESPHMI